MDAQGCKPELPCAWLRVTVARAASRAGSIPVAPWVARSPSTRAASPSASRRAGTTTTHALGASPVSAWTIVRCARTVATLRTALKSASLNAPVRCTPDTKCLCTNDDGAPLPFSWLLRPLVLRCSHSPPSSHCQCARDLCTSDAACAMPLAQGLCY